MIKNNVNFKIINSTPLSHDHNVGFHDIKPFNPNSKELLLLHRYPKKFLLNKNKLIKTEICLWDYNKNIIKKISNTTAFSWEQGSRLQWYSSEKIIFNLRKKNKIKTLIKNINNQKEEILDNSFYSLSCNKDILSLNYERLWYLWNTYGFYFNGIKQKISPKPDYDGIFIYNNKKKNNELILSIHDAVNLCNLEKYQYNFFLTHPTFSPDGQKFVSILRNFNHLNNLMGYMILTDIRTKKSKVIAFEKVSHFEWLNNSEIIVWCRNINHKISMLRNTKLFENIIVNPIKKTLKFINFKNSQDLITSNYYKININQPEKKIILDKNFFKEDGHPQLSKDKRFIITDTYEKNNGYQDLILYDLFKKKGYLLGSFKVSNFLKKNNLKCDLHPRWNNHYFINIDSSHQGSRQTYILDIENFIDKIR